MTQQIEVQTLETILSTLTEVNATLARRHDQLKRSAKGSWVMRAVGVLDAMEIVESMRNRIVGDIAYAVAPAKGLPEGLTVLTPEEVAARESKTVETALD